MSPNVYTFNCLHTHGVSIMYTLMYQILYNIFYLHTYGVSIMCTFWIPHVCVCKQHFYLTYILGIHNVYILDAPCVCKQIVLYSKMDKIPCSGQNCTHFELQAFPFFRQGHFNGFSLQLPPNSLSAKFTRMNITHVQQHRTHLLTLTFLHLQ